jgi:hypothetical protein
MILSDGLRPLRWKLRGEYVTDEEVRAVWANMGKLRPATRPLVPAYLRWDRSLGTLAVSTSLTIYESRYRRICCSVHFVGR